LAPWEAAQMAHSLIWPCQWGGGGKNKKTNLKKRKAPKIKKIKKVKEKKKNC